MGMSPECVEIHYIHGMKYIYSLHLYSPTLVKYTFLRQLSEQLNESNKMYNALWNKQGFQMFTRE